MFKPYNRLDLVIQCGPAFLTLACWCLHARLTAYGEYVVLDVSSDLDSASAFSVISSTQTRHVSNTTLMNIHHTICREIQGGVRERRRARERERKGERERWTKDSECDVN